VNVINKDIRKLCQILDSKENVTNIYEQKLEKKKSQEISDQNNRNSNLKSIVPKQLC
jgi:hypothetical protein